MAEYERQSRITLRNLRLIGSVLGIPRRIFNDLKVRMRKPEEMKK